MLAARGETEALGTQLDAIAGGGLTFVRAPLDWRELQPTRPVGGAPALDFNALDAWVGALAQRGLRWQAVLLGTPGPAWALNPAALQAGCGSSSPPARVEDFAAMAEEVAARYGDGGTFWEQRPDLGAQPVTDFEIWNEPNLAAYWCPGPDPAAYAELTVATARGVRAADPGAQIVLGGLSTVADDTVEDGATTRRRPGSFLADAVAAEPALAQEIDVAGLHSYGPAPADVIADVVAFRADLDSIGMESVPIALNEVGWATEGSGGFPPVAEQTRATYIAEVTRSFLASGCSPAAIAPHTWTTDELDPADPEDWFGIADPISGAPYPSGQAYLDAAADAREEAPQAQDGASSSQTCGAPR